MKILKYLIFFSSTYLGYTSIRKIHFIARIYKFLCYLSKPLNWFFSSFLSLTIAKYVVENRTFDLNRKSIYKKTDELCSLCQMYLSYKYPPKKKKKN